MKTIQLQTVERKNLGTSNSQKIRKQKQVPCVLYGDIENVCFSVSISDITPFIYTPHVFLAELVLGKEKHLAKIQEFQFHPVSDKVLHVDFLKITEKKPVKIKIPIKIEGTAKGVLAGGKLVKGDRTVEVLGNLKDLPDYIPVNTSDMEIGDTLRLEDVKVKKITLLGLPKTILVSVKPVRVTEEEKPTEEEAENESKTGVKSV